MTNPTEPPWLPNPCTGECPVPAGHDCEVKFADGYKWRCVSPEEWGWGDRGGGTVTHYRDWTAWAAPQAMTDWKATVDAERPSDAPQYEHSGVAQTVETVTIPAAEYEAMKAEIAELRRVMSVIEGQALCVSLRHDPDEADDWLHDIAQMAEKALNTKEAAE